MEHRKLPKQVIVVRKDLNMRKGKIASQAAHASLGTVLNKIKPFEITDTNIGNGNAVKYSGYFEPDDPMHLWLNGQFTKITVYVESEQELLDIVNKAEETNINVKLITDNGWTEFKGVPTHTCCALGPDWPDVLDPTTIREMV